jgi:hypothetical protein
LSGGQEGATQRFLEFALGRVSAHHGSWSRFRIRHGHVLTSWSEHECGGLDSLFYCHRASPGQPSNR